MSIIFALSLCERAEFLSELHELRNSGEGKNMSWIKSYVVGLESQTNSCKYIPFPCEGRARDGCYPEREKLKSAPTLFLPHEGGNFNCHYEEQSDAIIKKLILKFHEKYVKIIIRT